MYNPATLRVWVSILSFVEIILFHQINTVEEVVTGSGLLSLRNSKIVVKGPPLGLVDWRTTVVKTT